ncbi:MFS transporter [Opitutus sp. ER46]|uniref:MFS transporter n=1 Tax=Opitutus sp. ER46 TaxID=2161864 RepID=UPI000D320C33|nr:MFS transporter [Opitutus sp. ER46]PTX94512.1 MFS transporter [Opitutus sp. ER46]
MASPTDPAGAPATGAASAGGNFRWTVCGLLFFSVAINYIDRNIIAILKVPLSKELGWSDADYGHIAAAFQIAYAIGYLFGGRLMDRFGVKRALPWAVALWSVAAAAHGLCSLISPTAMATFSLPWFSSASRTLTFVLPFTALGFISARALLGLAEGGNFPGAIKAVAEWFPVKERALATGIFNAGTNVGAVLCPFAVPRLYAAWGWPMTFYVTGALGFVWLAAWWWLYENPEQQKRLSAAELAYIRAGQPKVVAAAPTVPWRSLLGFRATWAYLAASIFAGPVWNIYMFFLPDFLHKQYHLELTQIGNWTAIFYVIASFGGIAAGWLPGFLLGRGWTVNGARKISMLICALAVTPIFIAPHVPAVWLTVLIVGIAGSAHQGWSANQFSFASDTMPRQAISSLVGLGGFVGYFTGAVWAEVIPAVLKATGSYSGIFAVASVMYLVALLFLHLLVPKIEAAK